MTARQPIGAISIGSNDIHLLVATSDGVGTFDRQVNQSMLAELVGAVQGGVGGPCQSAESSITRPGEPRHGRTERRGQSHHRGRD